MCLCNSRDSYSCVSLALRFFPSTTSSSITFGILYWNCFSSSRPMVLLPPISWKSTWPRSHSLVFLLLTYYATRKRYLHLHDDALCTTAHGIPLCFCGSVATPASMSLARRYNSPVHVSLPSLNSAFFLSCISLSYHLSQGRHSMFLRPGHDFRSSFCTKRQRR